VAEGEASKATLWSFFMKAGIHPSYTKLVATCSCGNVIETRSTMGKETLYLDVCSACHPFYTGQQKVVDTGGRIDKFKQRFGMSRSLKR
jgi:large subunit ribosomal protein L31